MTSAEFFQQLEARIATYDLLCHPFYKAWSAGELTRDDLREYAQDYYHHVEAFPSYLAAFALRQEEGDLRRAVLATCWMKRAMGIRARIRSRMTNCGSISPRAWDHPAIWTDTSRYRKY